MQQCSAAVGCRALAAALSGSAAPGSRAPGPAHQWPPRHTQLLTVPPPAVAPRPPLARVPSSAAVRGAIALKSAQYSQQLAEGKGAGLPFDKVYQCNIGNPQILGQASRRSLLVPLPLVCGCWWWRRSRLLCSKLTALGNAVSLIPATSCTPSSARPPAAEAGHLLPPGALALRVPRPHGAPRGRRDLPARRHRGAWCPVSKREERRSGGRAAAGALAHAVCSLTSDPPLCASASFPPARCSAPRSTWPTSRAAWARTARARAR